MTSAAAKSMNISVPQARPRNVCISCGARLHSQVFDFGAMPISNSLLREEDLGRAEPFYPLRIMVCEVCSLVQLADAPPAEVHFHSDYVYFSSYSALWLNHCAGYADAVIGRFGLKPGDLVLEVASNDGYLLDLFRERGLDVLGVEPSQSVARAAIAKGIPTEIRFFGTSTAHSLVAAGVRPGLVVANNVFAHVPDLADFVEGFALLLSGDAVLTVEVHYFRELYEQTQFDSFYHEHYSYYTIRAADCLFARHGLRLFDVERLRTHGGSLRLYICREEASFIPTARLDAEREEDAAFIVGAMSEFADFGNRVLAICDQLRSFLIGLRKEGKSVAGFGAPAKATTLLNFASVTTDLLPYTVDSNPNKQGRYLPGIHLPILPPDALMRDRPDYVLVLPWNLRAEIAEVLSDLRAAGTKCVCAIPRLEVF